MAVTLSSDTAAIHLAIKLVVRNSVGRRKWVMKRLRVERLTV